MKIYEVGTNIGAKPRLYKIHQRVTRSEAEEYRRTKMPGSHLRKRGCKKVNGKLTKGMHIM